jgi:hypothetical protein
VFSRTCQNGRRVDPSFFLGYKTLGGVSASSVAVRDSARWNIYLHYLAATRTIWLTTPSPKLIFPKGTLVRRGFQLILHTVTLAPDGAEFFKTPEKERSLAPSAA